MPHKKHKKTRDYAVEFELICRLARRCDAEGVKRILRRGNAISLRQNRMTPVMQMACEGHDRAVQMLIDGFDASLHQVVDGYARAGRHDKVEEWIAKGASPAAAATGYLFGGFKSEALDCMLRVNGQDMSAEQREKYRQFLDESYHELHKQFTQPLLEAAIAGRFREVEDRVAAGEDIDDAVFGYAAGGHIPQVENLVSRGGSYRSAMSGYADGGFIDQVKSLHQQHRIDYMCAVKSFAANGLHRYVEEIFLGNDDWKDQIVRRAAEGYHEAGYFHHETITVRLLASIRVDSLRSTLAVEAEFLSGNPGCRKLNAKELIKKANKIRTIMREFHVNYDHAVALQTPGLITWLLQGQALKVSRDILLKIAAEMAQTSYDAMKVISAAVAAKTHDGAVERIKQKHAPGFFQRWGCCAYDEKVAQKKIRDEVLELDGRYQSLQRRTGMLSP